MPDRNIRVVAAAAISIGRLASLSKKPQVVGVGYAQAVIETIYPLARDIPMDVIVTERSVEQAVGRDFALNPRPTAPHPQMP
jgi:hypothetical protein